MIIAVVIAILAIANFTQQYGSVEHCNANAEAMGSNPVEALKIFFGLKFVICLNRDYSCDDQVSISFVFPQ